MLNTEIIKSILKKAMDGQLERQELYDVWASYTSTNEFIEEIFSDIEDALDHLPSHLLSNEIDIHTWHSSDNFRKLQADYVLSDQVNNLSVLQLQYRKRKLLNDL